MQLSCETIYISTSVKWPHGGRSVCRSVLHLAEAVGGWLHVEVQHEFKKLEPSTQRQHSLSLWVTLAYNLLKLMLIH